MRAVLIMATVVAGGDLGIIVHLIVGHHIVTRGDITDVIRMCITVRIIIMVTGIIERTTIFTETGVAL